GAHRPHRSHHVQLKGGVPVFVRDVVEVAALSGAGVVDQDVELTEDVGGRGDDPLAGVFGCHVEGQGCDLAALELAFSGCLCQPLLRARDQQHARALGAEPARRLATDAAAGTGHRTCPAAEAELHQTGSIRSSTSTLRSPVSTLWTGHLPAIDLSRSCCSSVSSLGSLIVTRNELGTPDFPYSRSTTTSRSPRSHPLRPAYISSVIAVQEASATAARRVGEGPWSAPPASIG